MRPSGRWFLSQLIRCAEPLRLSSQQLYLRRVPHITRGDEPLVSAIFTNHLPLSLCSCLYPSHPPLLSNFYLPVSLVRYLLQHRKPVHVCTSSAHPKHAHGRIHSECLVRMGVALITSRGKQSAVRTPCAAAVLVALLCCCHACNKHQKSTHRGMLYGSLCKQSELRLNESAFIVKNCVNMFVFAKKKEAQ